MIKKNTFNKKDKIYQEKQAKLQHQRTHFLDEDGVPESLERFIPPLRPGDGVFPCKNQKN